MLPPSFSASSHHWFHVATQDQRGDGPLREAIPDYLMHNTIPLCFAFTVVGALEQLIFFVHLFSYYGLPNKKMSFKKLTMT